ncbi:MAG: hypothetical protein J6Y86_05000 [Pseudobutyrivibrio sp.]|nr:hypothetical protein [Pseudobutyrivibrio sp.]
MAGSNIKGQTRKINERFFDEYKIFDEMLCERFNVPEHGVTEYIKRMKEAVTEAREAIPEWDVTYQRLINIKKRSDGLKNQELTFDDFQGKDEDVVWMNIFCEKMDANADPLSKYSTMSFTYKRRSKSLLQRIMDALNLG